ncbi:hypothetical protein [Marinoscillum sp. MHG1-6]|uniref:hypothetical protein n=1 Tax=Marinoscillum sp. MHG1-6 TaxID=2959627 RepID=UPI0021582FFA|nr:hypothetical protein [Marinoscillum sp. MHG1-6]
MNYHLGAPYVLFPFLFGISVPLANWNAVKYVKWRSTVTLGIISTALFFGTTAAVIALGNIHIVLSFTAVGLSGFGFLLFNSAFISTIRTNFLTGGITFILVAISIPIGKEALELLNKQGTDYTFLFSTFMTTLGICSSRLTSERTN